MVVLSLGRYGEVRMSRKRNRARQKRYPGKGRRLPLIKTDEVQPAKAAVFIKSSPDRIDMTGDRVSSGGRMGNRRTGWGEGGYVPIDVTASLDFGESYVTIHAEEGKPLFDLEYGRRMTMEVEPWGIIRDSDGQVLFEGRAEHADGYARGIMKIIRALERDEAGPWTRRPFIMNRRAGEYFYKGETHKRNDDGKWEAVELARGDVVVRVGQGGWGLEKFEQLNRNETRGPVIIAGKPGEEAHKAQSNAYGSSLDFEDKALMSGDFAARFDS